MKISDKFRGKFWIEYVNRKTKNYVNYKKYKT